MKGKFFANLAAGAAKIGKPILTVVKAKSPAILAGTAILGVVAVAVTAVKCTPKYKEAVKEAEETIKEQEDGSLETERVPMPKKEKTKIFVKTMWPMMVAILVTCASIIGSQAVNAKRIATLSAAYTLATQKATEAAEKKAEEFIKDKMGPEAASDYKKEREEEHAEVKRVENAIDSLNRVYDTGAGNQLFLNKDIGVLLRGSYAYIEACVEAFNNSAMANAGYGEQNFMAYNELMAQILGVDFEPDLYQLGNVVGYDADEICSKKRLMAEFSSESIRMPNGEAAIPFGMNIRPKGKGECVI
jgi:Tfp pilus assembly protein PilX